MESSGLLSLQVPENDSASDLDPSMRDQWYKRVWTISHVLTAHRLFNEVVPARRTLEAHHLPAVTRLSLAVSTSY